MSHIPKEIKYKIQDIDQDGKAEKILRKLGYKPNQIFSGSELWKKIKTLRAISQSEDIEKVTEQTMDTLFQSNMLEPYWRFISKDKIEELELSQGRKLVKLKEK